MGRIDDEHVDAGIDQALGAFAAGITDAVAAATSSRSLSSLRRRMVGAFSMSFTVMRPTQ